MKNTYLVVNDKAIAIVKTDLKSGTLVKCARNKTRNALNANREFDLVNAITAKVSQNKKHDKNSFELTTAIEINEGEFLI